VRPLPEELHGDSAEQGFSLQRVEGGPVEQQELHEYLSKELLKVLLYAASELIWHAKGFLMLR
jgi:hypothetical protein